MTLLREYNLLPRSSEKGSEVIFYFESKEEWSGGRASKRSIISQNDYATWPLQLLRRRIEDDGAAYRRKRDVLIRIQNTKSK